MFYIFSPKLYNSYQRGANKKNSQNCWWKPVLSYYSHFCDMPSLTFFSIVFTAWKVFCKKINGIAFFVDHFCCIARFVFVYSQLSSVFVQINFWHRFIWLTTKSKQMLAHSKAIIISTDRQEHLDRLQCRKSSRIDVLQ